MLSLVGALSIQLQDYLPLDQDNLARSRLPLLPHFSIHKPVGLSNPGQLVFAAVMGGRPEDQQPLHALVQTHHVAHLHVAKRDADINSGCYAFAMVQETMRRGAVYELKARGELDGMLVRAWESMGSVGRGSAMWEMQVKKAMA